MSNGMLRVAAGLLAVSFSSAAYALPTLNATDTVAKLSQDALDHALLKGASFFADSNAANKTIYVSPAHRKAETGIFQRVAPTACDTLADLYALTYAVPNSTYEEAAKHPYSPFFDYFYGNYMRNMTLITMLNDKLTQLGEAKEAHKDVYAEFTRRKFAYDKAIEDVSVARRQLDALNAAVTDASQRVAQANNAEERTTHLATKEAAEKSRETLAQPAQAAYDDAVARERQGREPYAQALAAWAPYAGTVQEITAEVSALTKAYAVIQELSRQAFLNMETLLQRRERDVVGLASASFTLYDGELNAARHIVPPGYVVHELPVHNVSLSPVIEPFAYTQTVSDGTETVAAETMETSSIGSSVQEAVGTTWTAALPTFTDEQGSSLPFGLRNAGNDDGATFRVPITRGAFCTGSSQRRSITFSAAAGPATTVQWQGAAYVPRDRSTVMAQSIALTYDYYVQADPIRVACEYNFSSLVDYLSKVDKSRHFFDQNKWDDEDRQGVSESGVHCDVLEAPVGDDPDAAAQQKRVQDLQQRMEQELVAEFVAHFGKSWDVTRRTPTTSPDELIDRGRYLGPAMMNLCGASPYCIISHLAIRLFGDMVGTSTARARLKDQLHGTVKRIYNERAYRRLRGVAAIDVVVEGT